MAPGPRIRPPAGAASANARGQSRAPDRPADHDPAGPARASVRQALRMTIRSASTVTLTGRWPAQCSA